MNNSVDGVTLYAGFLFDLLECYKESQATFARELFAMASSFDPNRATDPVPILTYNDMCQWIEDNLGVASLRRAGVAIGSRAYDQMIETGVIHDRPAPLEILEGLKQVASVMIQDPAGRGWEILAAYDRRIVLRRTQTFNCFLQEGLLKSLVERTGVRLVSVQHDPCTRSGSEFCDYTVTWMR